MLRVQQGFVGSIDLLVLEMHLKKAYNSHHKGRWSLYHTKV